MNNEVKLAIKSLESAIIASAAMIARAIIMKNPQQETPAQIAAAISDLQKSVFRELSADL